MHPNKAKSFPAATVPAVAKLGYRRPKVSTMEKPRHGGSAALNTSENEGQNLVGRKHLELSERRRVCAWKKRRGKRAERKSARKKHKAASARSRLEKLMFGMFNVCTAAVNGVNGIAHMCCKGL